MKKLFTIEQISQEMHITIERLRELAESGYIPCVRLDDHERIMFPASAKTWIKENLYQEQEGRPFPKKILFLLKHEFSPKWDRVPEELAYLKDNLREYSIPRVPSCIYFLCKNQKIVYIGQSVALSTRIETHLIDSKKEFDSVFFIEVPRSDLNEVEKMLIKKYQPELNVTHLNKRVFPDSNK